MVAPIVYAIGAGLASFFNEEIRDLGKTAAREVGEKAGKAAAQYALQQMGIEIDLDGEVNQQTLTQAVNASPVMGGVEFTNLFDKEAVKADVKRIALDRAAQAFGYDGGAGVEGIRDKIVSDLIEELKAEKVAGGPLLLAARDLVATKQAIESKPDLNYNRIRDFSAKGVSNRERQAKYRAGRTKIWVER